MLSIDQELLRKYFDKTLKDFDKLHNKQIRAELKAKHYEKVLRLQAEAAGARSIMVCLFRGHLFNPDEATIPSQIKGYLKAVIK
jgi:hypothetical protein